MPLLLPADSPWILTINIKGQLIRRSTLGKRSDKVITTTLFAMVLFWISLIGGCGGSEAEKAATDLVKKVIGGEVAKQGDAVKKQIDQIINLGSDKGKKEGEGSTAGETGKGSEKEDQEGSGEKED
jgi:hypothetical protein